MKDNEIIKALKCCINNKCSNCPLRKMACSEHIAMENALDLINRQQAEIERLKGWQDLLKAEKHSLIKAEAIKAFAERLKAEMLNVATVDFGGYTYFCVGTSFIDNLVKEMTEKGR